MDTEKGRALQSTAIYAICRRHNNYSKEEMLQQLLLDFGRKPFLHSFSTFASVHMNSCTLRLAVKNISKKNYYK